MHKMFPSGLKTDETFISEWICTSRLGQIISQAFVKNQTSRHRHQHGAENSKFHPAKGFSHILKVVTRKLRATCGSKTETQATIRRETTNTGIKYHHLKRQVAAAKNVLKYFAISSV